MLLAVPPAKKASHAPRRSTTLAHVRPLRAAVGMRFAITLGKKEIEHLSIAERAEAHTFGNNVGQGHSAGIICLKYDAGSDGESKRIARVVSGSWDETIKLWNIETGACMESISLVNELDETSERKECTCERVIDGGDGKPVTIYGCTDDRDFFQPACFNTCKCFVHGAAPLSLLLDQQEILIAGCSDGSIRCYDFRQSQSSPKPWLLQGIHTQGVHLLQWTQNGHAILSGSHDGTVREWDLRALTKVKEYESEEIVNTLVFKDKEKDDEAGTGADPFYSMWGDQHKLILAHHSRLQVLSTQHINNDKLPSLPGYYSNVTVQGQTMMAAYRNSVVAWKVTLDESLLPDGTSILEAKEAAELAAAAAAAEGEVVTKLKGGANSGAAHAIPAAALQGQAGSKRHGHGHVARQMSRLN